MTEDNEFKDAIKRFREVPLFVKVIMCVFLPIYLAIVIPCLIVLTPIILVSSIKHEVGKTYKARLIRKYMKTAHVIGEVMAGGIS